VYALALFSPDSQRLLTTSEQDRTARLWDAQSGQPLTEPIGHGGQVWSAKFSPDGMRIVTASDDGTARIWAAQTGHVLAEPLKSGGPAHTAEFSPDGSRIVTASGDKTVRIWEALGPQALAEPLKDFGQILAVSPDATRFATTLDDDAKRCPTGSPKGRRDRSGHCGSNEDSGVVLSANFSPDGKRIVTASTDGVRVWDAQAGRPLTAPLRHAGVVRWAQFSSDGKRIVTGQGTVWLARDAPPPPSLVFGQTSLEFLMRRTASH